MAGVQFILEFAKKKKMQCSKERTIPSLPLFFYDFFFLSWTELCGFKNGSLQYHRDFPGFFLFFLFIFLIRGTSSVRFGMCTVTSYLFFVHH